MLLAHHRDFLTSVRRVQQTELEENQGFSAAANSAIMALDHISIGPDFVAVAGIFSDHAFLEYLYQQTAIDYVEQNQVFKSTHIRPTKEELFVRHKKRDLDDGDGDDDDDNDVDGDGDGDDDNEKKDPIVSRKDVRKVQTGSSANWGLARINQRERGDLDEYEYDTMGG
jgi:hypothetical protein